jgi:hypothetical protein
MANTELKLPEPLRSIYPLWKEHHQDHVFKYALEGHLSDAQVEKFAEQLKVISINHFN